jgi:hypothetical protein
MTVTDEWWMKLIDDAESKQQNSYTPTFYTRTSLHT